MSDMGDSGEEEGRKRSGVSIYHLSIILLYSRFLGLVPNSSPIYYILTLVFPPSESCNNLVSFESRYGMCLPFASTRADITFPRADKERLILEPKVGKGGNLCVR